MPKKEDYYILSKGSALQGYKYIQDVVLRDDGELDYTLDGNVKTALWFKKGLVDTIATLDKDIKIKKIVLKDVDTWK